MEVTVPRHGEKHYSGRAGWLRAAVLGANDGIVSISSLVLGVAAASGDGTGVLVAGFAGLVGGALSMAAGEFVSVASQKDAEQADIAKETWELEHQTDAELVELQGIWQRRGLPAPLAREVAEALHDHDALEAHLRDELGIDPEDLARPVQAAWTSALAFLVGGGLPVVVAWQVGDGAEPWVLGTSLVALAITGALGARAGGAPVVPGTLRVVVGGALAMAVTMGLGRLFGVAV